MSYTALYRELRPRTFKDVIGQEHITRTLKNEIQDGRIAHAYLFSGTRGTGKTTCAKILSKALNCLNLEDGEPCNKCENCKRIDSGLSLDVIEQDAATNNKVDDIRDLIDEVQYPPQEGKYKVYILDEAHMLTMGAVNAFLKTLEEPPANTVFILATTDPQKLPITILSRCQRFEFKRIKAKDIENRLTEITKERNIESDERSIELIARVSEGAMRDALSILDQSISMGQGVIKYDVVVSMLGLMGKEKLFKLAECILKKDLEGALSSLDEILDGGKDPYFISRDLLEHFRNILITKLIKNNPHEVIEASREDIERYEEQSTLSTETELIKMIRNLQVAEEQSKRSSQGRIYLELSIIKICNEELEFGIDALRTQVNQLEDKIQKGEINIVKGVETGVNVTNKSAVVKSQGPKVKKEITKIEVVENKDSKVTIDDVRDSWAGILELLKANRQMIVRASLTEGKIKEVKNGVITIEFNDKFSHNKKRLEKAEYIDILKNAFKTILKEDISIRFTVENEEDEEYSDLEKILKDKEVTDIDIK